MNKIKTKKIDGDFNFRINGNQPCPYLVFLFRASKILDSDNAKDAMDPNHRRVLICPNAKRKIGETRP